MFMFGQKDTYLAEIGVSGGVSFYKGDGSSSLFSNLQPVYGGLLRYNINPAFALCFDLSRTSIKGSYIDSNVTYTFKNQNDALDVLVEFNFFDLEQIKNNDNQERKLSPYIFAGYGLLKYSYENQSKLNPQFPFGIGLKYKLKNRWNLNLQWTNRVLFADDMNERVFQIPRTDMQVPIRHLKINYYRMKKIILSALLLVGVLVSANAQKVAIVDMEEMGLLDQIKRKLSKTLGERIILKF